MDVNTTRKIDNQTPKSVVILEDEGLTAYGAEVMLNNLGYRVLYNGSSVNRLREEMLAADPPEVAFIDLKLQLGYDGLKAVRAAGAIPNVRTLVMTAVTKPEILALARHWGANGVADKVVAQDDLHEALMHLAHGGEYMKPTVKERIAHGWWFVERLERFGALDPAERQVVRWIGQGKTSAEIAGKLKMKRKTVANRRNLISARLELKEHGGLERFAQLVASVPSEEIG